MRSTYAVVALLIFVLVLVGDHNWINAAWAAFFDTAVLWVAVQLVRYAVRKVRT